MLLSLISFSLPVPRIQPPNLLHLSRGHDGSSQIDVFVDPKVHVQANPASRRNLIPTELTLVPPAGVSVKSVSYPAGSPLHAGGISVYQGDFGIRFALHAARRAHLGKQLIRAKLRYQCCDEKTCFRPGEVSFDFWVDIQ